MNAQERDLLQSFLRDVSQSRPAQKDPVAEAMIREALGPNSDALYLLAQRALGAEVALKREAQKSQSQAGSQAQQLANSQAESPKPASPAVGSFLGTAAGVATGVVAGSFLLEGIQAAFRDTGLDENLAEGFDAIGDITDWV